MTRLAVIAILALALTGAACPRENDVKPRDVRSTDQPRPRDGNIAIQQELDAARRTGTVEAYDLFLARHPRHRLAETARRERARLSRD